MTLPIFLPRLCEWGYLIVTADEVALYEAQANSFWSAFV
jgi:hypothetical protein